MYHGPRSIPLCIQHHIPFIPSESTLPFLRYNNFNVLPWKIHGQGHGWGRSWKSQYVSNILSTHIPLVPYQLAIPFLRYDFFKIWSWKSKIKVMGEVNVKVTTWVQHFIGSPLFRFMSIGHPIPEIRPFQNLTFKIQGQGRGWGQSWKSQSGCNIPLTHISFVPCQSTLLFPWYKIF